MTQLHAFLTPTFPVPANKPREPPLLQDVSKEPHARYASLVTSAQFMPARDTDKFFMVSHRDHLLKDLDVLPSTVSPFWPEISIHGEVHPESRVSLFLLDLKMFLTYMYPARASAPLCIHVTHQTCSSNGVQTQEVDILRLQMEEETLAVLVILETPGILREQDWKRPDYGRINFQDTSIVPGNYLAYLQSLDIDGLTYAAFLDFKSTVVVNLSRSFSYVSFEEGPYLPALTLLSEVFLNDGIAQNFHIRLGKHVSPEFSCLAPEEIQIKSTTWISVEYRWLPT
ncbi:hypothetical protein BT69DRAFT_357999 [Atractiella rhizophila]|nr:hypothetical protein BT69DRAFT_357999 [Atractiella rhizophila]